MTAGILVPWIFVVLLVGIVGVIVGFVLGVAIALDMQPPPEYVPPP